MLKLVPVKPISTSDEFSGVARILHASSYLSDNELADAIVEHCGSLMTIDLNELLKAVPDLQTRPVALDAAIEVTLKSMRRAGTEGNEAAESLAQRFPSLASAIRTAHALGEAMGSTTSLALRSGGRDAISLPFDVGPVQSSGALRYQLHQLLGIGSEGAVYLAQDRSLSEPGSPAWVAIKHVSEAASPDEALRARRVVHPNVVRVLDKVPGPSGSWMLVFEFVRGGSLEKKWGTKGFSDRSRAAAEMILQIGKGVQAAHSAGLIHRDLKPANILLTEEGVPKVSDFGISHSQNNSWDGGVEGGASSGVGDRSGSLGFMSPEQFRGANSSVAEDVYALGGLLFWMITGALPNGATRQVAVDALSAVAADRAGAVASALSHVDQDLALICQRALAVRAEDRYASADRFTADIESWLAHEPIAWTRPTALRKSRLAVRRSPVAWSIAVLGVVAGTALVLGAGYKVGSAEVARQQAEIALLKQRDVAEQDRVQSADMMTGMVAKYLRLGSEDSAGASWLHMLTFIESMMGARISVDPTDGENLWKSRVRVATEVIAEAKSKGRGEDLETLMLESSLCLWLLRANEPEKSLKLLDSVEPRWQSMLQPDDEWFTYMKVFRKCGEVLSVDPALPDGPAKRRALYSDAVAQAKKLDGEAARPVRMLLDRVNKVVDGNEPAKL